MKHKSSGISIRDKVAGQLRQAIIRRELAPGDHLTEQGIAERYKVSRSPVREALAMLQRLGLVEYIRNRGMFVAELNIAQIEEVYRIRSVLEGLICELGAQRCAPQDITDLREINSAMASTLENVDRFIALNVDFHRRLHTIANSPLTSQLIEDLWDRSEGFRRTTWLNEEAMLESVNDHELIIHALETKDTELARHMGSRAVTKRFPKETALESAATREQRLANQIMATAD